MISVCGFILMAVSCRCLACEDDCITIGIISNGTGVIETETLSKQGRLFKMIRHLVDTTETYEVFRSVQSLDADENVDIITMLNYDVTVLMTPQILTTQNKKLIKMGADIRYSQTNWAWQKGNTDSCHGDGEVKPAASSEDMYCIMDLDLIKVDRDDELLLKPGPRALRSIIKSLKWTSIIILYERSTEVETTTLVDGLSKDGVLFALFNAEHENNIKKLLLEIYHSRKTKEITFVVLCRFHCTREILQNANKVDSLSNGKTLLKMFSRWLIVLYGHTRHAAQILRNCANDLDNVAIIAVPDFTVTDIKSVSDIIHSTLLDIHREEINSYADFKENFLNEFEKNLQTRNPSSKCQAYHIDTLLWTKKGREFSSVGYAEVLGNVVLQSDIFPNTKYGYNKRNFLVSTLEYKPFVKRRESNATYIYEGFCIDLLKELANRLNFTYDLTEPADGNWGTYSENRTFDGLVGQLQRHEVDIVAAPITSSPIRSPVMDFSYCYYYEYTTVLVKKPDPNSTKWRTLIDPFKWEVLVAIGASLVTVTILVFLLEKYNPFYDVPEHAENRATNGGLHTWHSSFWYVFGALLCQGGVHLPDSTSGRTLISFWWLTCIIIVGTYCGNLIAFLTITKEQPPFNTLQEMLELKGTYTWGTLGGTSWEREFPDSSNPTFKAIGEAYLEFSKKDPTVLDTNLSVHVEKVKRGNYGWIGDKTSMELKMAKECSLMSIKQEFMPLMYVFGFTEKSPHTEVFSEQMMKINEGGLLQIWKRKWWPKASFCAGNTLPEAKPISLMNVQSAFYVCFVGIFLGSLAFLIEIVWHKCRILLQNSKRFTTDAGLSREIYAYESNDAKRCTPCTCIQTNL